MTSHIWHPYTKHSAVESGDLPDIVRGEGVFLETADGRRFVDILSSWWCAALGHSHPAIVNAIQDQTAKLQHSILGNLSHPAARSLAERLSCLLPGDEWRTHFASDGASAVEVALKVALQYAWNRGEPRRQSILSLREAYHGDTLGTVSLGFIETFHKPYAAMLRPSEQIPVPPYDGSEAACLDAVRELLDRQGDRLAAVIVEPLCQGAAGMRIYSPGYLRKLCEMTQERGALFIVDEIATGFWRTGKCFAFEHAGIVPDIVCVGKALSAGALPISAAIVRPEVYATFGDEPEDRTLYHGHTFAGNPVACRAALAALEVYAGLEFQADVIRKSALLARWMQELRGVDGVVDVRTLGMMGAVELRDEAQAKVVRDGMMAKGYLLRPLDAVVYLMPPLVISDSILEEAVDCLGACLVLGA